MFHTEVTYEFLSGLLYSRTSVTDKLRITSRRLLRFDRFYRNCVWAGAELAYGDALYHASTLQADPNRSYLQICAEVGRLRFLDWGFSKSVYGGIGIPLPGSPL